jgi:2-polyprenyl-3-methyl-5-hydroxy-6-metoxy-1,4-benzoquinol methylase
MKTDSDTLERLVPDLVESGEVTGDETLELHLERYRFAARHGRPGRLLDLACGVGYGTRLLTDARGDVEAAVGVDLSQEAIAYAEMRYGNERTRYVQADALSFRDPQGFDTIVTLETIEHLPQPSRFIGHLASLLRPGGVIIASVPTTPSADANPHHLHDFTERSFAGLFSTHGFEARQHLRQVQRYGLSTLAKESETRTHAIRAQLGRYYLRHPGALAKRVVATLRYGLANHYSTVVWGRRV